MADQDIQTISDAVCGAVMSAFSELNGNRGQASSTRQGTSRRDTTAQLVGVTPPQQGPPVAPHSQPNRAASLPSFLRRRKSHSASTSSSKRPKLLKSWDKDIICLPHTYSDSDSTPGLSIPRGKKRALLGELGLIGKIHLTNAMEQHEILDEIRSVFQVPMRSDPTFGFTFLETALGSKTLIAPRLSRHFVWTAEQVVGLGQGAIYIIANEALDLPAAVAADLSEHESDENIASEHDNEVREEPSVGTTETSTVADIMTSNVHSEVSNDYLIDDELDIFDENILPNSPSIEPEVVSEPVCAASCNSLSDIIQRLKREVMMNGNDTLTLEFRRHTPVEDALMHIRKQKFDPTKTLKVVFIGEEAVDIGGLRREFWRLLRDGISQKFCIGDGHSMTFVQNVPALTDKVYHYLGVWTAMSVVQEGQGFPLLCPGVYQYMVTRDITVNIANDTIPDPAIKSLVASILACSDDTSLQSLFTTNEAVAALLLETGFAKPIHTLRLDDRPGIVSMLKTFHCLIKVKAQVDQFVEGLSVLKIDKYIRDYPDIMRPLFVNDTAQWAVNSEYIKTLLLPKFSPMGSNRRNAEEDAHMMFIHFLDECEEGTVEVTLQEIMIFFTGGDSKPACRYSQHPELCFLHGDATLATASTCSLQLYLPTCCRNYEHFRERMVLSFKGHGGFGKI